MKKFLLSLVLCSTAFSAFGGFVRRCDVADLVATQEEEKKEEENKEDNQEVEVVAYTELSA